MHISIVARFGCEVCGKPFSRGKQGFECRQHKTKPNRFYLDFTHAQKRTRLFCDKGGIPLDTYSRAVTIADLVKAEIQNHSFNAIRYKESEPKKYSFEYQITNFNKEKKLESEKGNIAPSYLDSIKNYIDNYYIPHFKTADVRDITSSDIKDFYLSLPAGRTPKTISNILNFLRHFFNSLKRYDIIDKIPSFPVIRIQEPSPRWTTTENQQKLLDAIQKEHFPVFCFILRQGCRPSESRSLQWGDLLLDSGIVTIKRTFSNGRLIERTKGRVERPRLLHPEVLEMLKNMKPGFPKDYVFKHPKTGKHYSKTRLECIFMQARKATGIDINLYSAGRHSVATNAIYQNNVPLNVVKDYLCQADIKSTMKYIHADILQQNQIFQKPSAKIIPIQAGKKK